VKNFSWRAIIILAVIITGFVYILPTIKPGIFPYKKINLGLDLQGGMHLVLEVDTDKAVESTIERNVQGLHDMLREKGIRYQTLERVEGTKISVNIADEKNISGFNEVLDKDFSNLRVLSRDTENNVLKVMMDLPEQEVAHIKKFAVDQALETIRNRIDEFGVSEPDIRKQGEKRLLIQLPGVSDTKRAKQLIGRTALLEFKLLDESVDPATVKKEDIPKGSELLYEVRTDRTTNRESKTPYVVKKRASLTGVYLTDARVQIDSEYNDPYVSITFSNEGARIFERITGENVKKRLAIVLDNKIYSAPVIQEKISGGEARITGSFTAEEARDLAIVLRAGALPAPVKILEERTVGPSLGKDSIKKGLISTWVGGLLVVLFMAVYYKVSGIIADIALIFNILLIAAGLAALQATLTLPGIAGIILTIGMAVDANVLIYERIREELNLGKTMYSAMSAGYERATLTILDSNITTLIAAVVLFQFGTGPIKGFAVTLSLGLIASLFTALIVTRLIFDYLLINLRIKTLSI